MTEAAEDLNYSSRSIEAAFHRINVSMSNLSSGPAALKTKYEATWTKMQNLWAKEQTAAAVAPMTCYQKADAKYIASDISYELSNIKYYDTDVTFLRHSVDSDLAEVSKELSSYSTWAPIYDQRYMAYNNHVNGHSVSPGMAKRASSKRSMVAAQIAAVRTAILALQEVATTYDREGADLTAKAKSLSDAIVCSG